MSAPLLRVEGISKTYREAGVDTPVLDEVSFDLGRGETASLVGASGAGKSTLLGLLAGLMLPDSGSVCFDGAEITALDETARARLRARRIGVVLQNDNLIPFLTALENVELAMEFADAESRGERAGELLEDLGLGDRLDELPRRLSGGEAQRASLAVALANQPELLLADEITAELDAASAERMIDAILAAARERELAVLIVTHSGALAERTERRLQVAHGKVIGA